MFQLVSLKFPLHSHEHFEVGHKNLEGDNLPIIQYIEVSTANLARKSEKVFWNVIGIWKSTTRQ